MKSARTHNIRTFAMPVLLLLTSVLAQHAEAAQEQRDETARWQRQPSLSCTKSSLPVTLTSSSAAGIIGLEFEAITEGTLDRVIERNAEIAYNANRYARLSSRAGGVVAEVTKDLGEPVAKGDVLAVIDSSEVGSAKSDLLLALETARLWEANAARERALVDRGVGVEREALEAETKAAEARIEVNRMRQRLRNLGLSAEQVSTVERESDTSSLLELVAPFDATIVDRLAVMGEVVEPGRPVLAIADTGTMWAMVDLVENDLAVVAKGQAVVVAPDGLGGRSFEGRLTWISTQIDHSTRTLKARVELDNSSSMLRANMFARARINAGESRQAVTVPKDAVQWEGCCNVAFVATGDPALFRPVRLVLAYDAGERYEVVSGLRAGDRVVTRGSYILKNEILKDAVGAGCCEVDHLDK